MKIENAADLSEHQQHYKIAVYGGAGTGKTSLGATAPGPVLYIALERQGVAHLRLAIKRLGRDPSEYTVLTPDSVEDLRAIGDALHGDQNKPFVLGGHELPWPRSVVIDSFTDAADKLEAAVSAKYPETPKGRPSAYWTKLGESLQRMITVFRDAPAHVLFICEQEEISEGRGENKRTRYAPNVAWRKRANDLCYGVNVVGWTYRKTTQGQGRQLAVEYGIATVMPSNYVTKPLAPLRQAEVPDLSSWIARLNGAVDTSTAEVSAPDELVEDTLDGRDEARERADKLAQDAWGDRG